MTTSALQRRASELMSTYFGGLTIRENYRPAWMINEDGQRLELDFYIEETNIALEVQGNQHYRFSSVFHSDYNDYLAQVKRDEDKKRLCIEHGVKLFYASNEREMIEAVEEMCKFVSVSTLPTVFKFSSMRFLDHISWQFGRYAKSLKKELSSEHPRPERVKKLQSRMTKLISKHEIDARIINQYKELFIQDNEQSR